VVTNLPSCRDWLEGAFFKFLPAQFFFHLVDFIELDLALKLQAVSHWKLVKLNV